MKPYSWDGHLLLVHNSEQQRRAGVAAWVRRGLELDAKILYTEPAGESPERSLIGLLRDTEIDVDEVVQSGQLEVLPADGTAYSPAFQASAVERALAAGYPTVRWSGEAETAWSVISPTAHADVEWATNELCHARPVSILCQYRSGLSQATLQTVCAMHEGSVRESLLHTSPIPDGIALAGEVDVSNEAVLHSALTAAGSGLAVGGGPLVVDLGDLGFLDVAGAQAFLSATLAHRTNGGNVLLRGAQPGVERILRLLNVDHAPGCVLEGPR